eukprot:TRINITY_DN6340_c0_g1_i1.p2 TRINITY_DN6340_c0_g1~~TRINITY_DN6340_c0_g1_i1.p2  ORF type:complete len:537 (+),score=59.10 TRINITY_DN6340_c0_g1_i1:62-1672(+)
MKITFGVCLVAVAAVVAVVQGAKPIPDSSQYQEPWASKYTYPKDRALQLTQGGYTEPDCGLSGFPAYVPGGCVYMGPDADIDKHGLCESSTSPYRAWCTKCYDFPGQKWLGKAVGTTYTDVLTVSSDADDVSCPNAMTKNTGDCDCEFNTDNCPTVVDSPNSCWTSVNITQNCLANTDNDFDFGPLNGGTAMHGLVNHCCGLQKEEYVDANPRISTCFEVEHDEITGCITSATWKEGQVCYPIQGNKCERGTCQTVDGVRECASAPVTCDDDNDCTIDGDCDPNAEGDPCSGNRIVEDDGTPCRSSEPCKAGGTCAAGTCANAQDVVCQEGVCDPELNQCVERTESSLLPLGLAAAGGLCCLGAAAAILAKKRKDAQEEWKRDSIMTQKTDNMSRSGMGMDARKSGMSAVTSFSRGPGATGGASGGTDFDQVSHAPRRSDAVSVQSRVSRVSNGTRTTRSSQGSGGRRSSSGRGSAGRRSSSGRGSAGRRESEKYDFKSSGTRSSGGRSSQSRSRNSQGTRSSGSRGRSTGSRGRH